MISRDELMDLVFAKLTLVYGRDFLSKWEGLDMAEVRADWMRELGPILSSPMSIRYGLENLPADRVPNVLQFRAICEAAPKPYQRPEALLPRAEHVATAEDKARVRAMLAKAKASITGAA